MSETELDWATDPLARLLHEFDVGCDWEPNSPNDIGMGYHHTGSHAADARALRDAIMVEPSHSCAAGVFARPTGLGTPGHPRRSASVSREPCASLRAPAGSV